MGRERDREKTGQGTRDASGRPHVTVTQGSGNCKKEEFSDFVLPKKGLENLRSENSSGTNSQMLNY